MRIKTGPFILFISLLSLLSPRTVSYATDHSSLIDTPAQEWKVRDWINSPRLKLKDLRGKVVLVRFWTAPFCPFCINSAPALNEFYETYHDRGLEVVGLYTHKGKGKITKKKVKRYANRFGFEFPVAIDNDWKTLKKWWIDTGARRWTSVSFLIDKKGIIRHIHPGGQYREGDEDYIALKAKIEGLLKE